MQRPLSLHVSALNGEEYASFTSHFYDLLGDDAHLDDAAFDKQTVSLREARAWLRGRYADLPVAQVDEVLRLFTPGDGKSAVLNGGQFCALLRIVLHMRAGQKLDRNLAFQQVQLPKQSVLGRKSFEAPPRHPPQTPTTPRSRQPSSNSQYDLPTSDKDNNPFHNLTNGDLPPPVPPLPPHARLGSVSAPSAVSDTPAPALPTKHHANNPFVSRSKTIHSTTRPSVINVDRAPPTLPPRKPPPVIPPRITVPVVPASPAASSSKPTPPPIAPKTSDLMKQSIRASRAAQDAKRAEHERSATRIFQILKSSTGSGSGSASPPKLGSRSSSSSGESAPRPKLPPRRRASPPPSAASVYSFEQVASATLPDGRGRSGPFRRAPSPPRTARPPSALSASTTTDVAALAPPRAPPPRHPDTSAGAGKADAAAPASPVSPRLGRSKSMHQTGAPPVPPPLRRKRPESVQVLSTPTASPHTDVFSDAFAAPSRPSQHAAMAPLGRHTSLTGVPRAGAGHARQQSVEEGAAAALHQFRGALDKLAPKIDAARYKAEAGLSKRGFVPIRRRTEGAQRLVDSDEEDDGAGPGAIEEEEEREQARGDEMKWPAGEGWRALR